jgi:hypothetical protein
MLTIALYSFLGVIMAFNSLNKLEGQLGYVAIFATALILDIAIGYDK